MQRSRENGDRCRTAPVAANKKEVRRARLLEARGRGKKDRAFARDLHPPRPRGDQQHDKTTNQAHPVELPGARNRTRDSGETDRPGPYPAGSMHHLPDCGAANYGGGG